MKITHGSATHFILRTLRKYADRELRVDDLATLAGDTYTKENIVKATYFLLNGGLIARYREGGAAWWAVSADGLAFKMPKG